MFDSYDDKNINKLIYSVIIIPISTAIYWTFSRGGGGGGGGGEGFHKSVQLTLSVTKSICVRPLTENK